MAAEDGRATLATVARRAGVSRQTVSNAINSPELVRTQTLDRVRRAITDLGYRPSRTAKALRTGTPRTVGLALAPPGTADGAGGVGDRFLRALAAACHRRDYRILLLAAHSPEDEIAQYADALDAGEIESVVLTGTHYGDPRTEWLERRGARFVTFGRPWNLAETRSHHSWVDVDGAEGTAAAVDHLVALGHTRIAFLGWPAGSGVGDDRRAGWLRAVRRLGLPAATEPAVWDTVTANEVRPAVAAARRLLEGSLATAVVCVSDTVALGVLHAVQEWDGAVAVTGFDDSPVAAAVGLTSLAQPLAQAAERTAALLLDDGPGATAPVEALLHPALVVRESTTQPAP